ncbi:polycystin-2 isoform X1 [Drosophila subpulchrella]|uniref:polycystin-2 isoform X1 n=2 Tax=Drosophila subpulchrella TaxID=1486046 RepID=UPI0018A18A45|nr:polycystin-2 isoform X1 [Drosophila subpulchrella]
MTKKNSNIIFYMALVIIALCGFCIWNFSGFNHEDAKFNMILVAFLTVTLIQVLVFTPIKYAILAMDTACWPAHQSPVTPDENARVETFLDKARIRLRSLRSELMITESHRNEKLNLKYRLIKEELFLTGKLFILYFIMSLVLFDELDFYNNNSTRNLFKRDHKYTVGLSDLVTLSDVYTFLEFSLIVGFTDGDSTGLGSHWIHAEPVRMLGVVRLRQLRTEDSHVGLKSPVFTNEDFSEGWKLPYEWVPYTNKYWPIYSPWLGTVSDFRDNLVMGINHHGHFIKYPEMAGYKILLSDTRNKSLIILYYLIDNVWLDYNTSALFMDFTMYNADANIFSVCTLWVEQFPFGDIHSHVEIESHMFVDQIREMSKFGMLVLFFTVIVWLQFAKAFFVKVWFEPRLIKTLWIQVDALIVGLSLTAVIILAIRDNLVQSMIHEIEISVMVEFIDFREPARLTYFCDVIEGFSIALVTMRLWKVMQFSGTFQLFTKTISMAWQALIWTMVVTVIFIVAIALATVTINGNNRKIFRDLPKGIVTVTSFAFGYSNVMTPLDLSFGGEFLGIILYVIMGFVVKYLLINLIISMMRALMANAKANRDRKVLHRISFWEFLRVEYADCINFILEVTQLKKGYKSHNRTVSENVERKLKNQERMDEMMKGRQAYPGMIPKKQRDEGLIQLRHRERIERTITLGAILQTQMELIEKLMFGDDDGNLPSLDVAEENISST